MLQCLRAGRTSDKGTGVYRVPCVSRTRDRGPLMSSKHEVSDPSASLISRLHRSYRHKCPSLRNDLSVHQIKTPPGSFVVPQAGWPGKSLPPRQDPKGRRGPLLLRQQAKTRARRKHPPLARARARARASLLLDPIPPSTPRTHPKSPAPFGLTSTKTLVAHG